MVRFESFTNYGYSANLDAFEWPNRTSLQISQQKYLASTRLTLLISRSDGLYSVDTHPTKCWIPMKDKTLRVSLCILAHCGLGGHRSLETSKKNLYKDFFWRTWESDIEHFCSTCLQCKQTKGGHLIPRPFGNVLCGTYRNEMIIFDFLYIEKPSLTCPHTLKYILIIKDTFSHYVRLYPTSNADTNATVQGLLDWFGIFGKPKVLISDQGSHFKNKVVTQLAKSLNISKHHFTVPHCPYGRGSIERVNLEVLNLLTMLLLSETGQPTWQWPYYCPSVMDILVSYESPTLSNKCPRRVMMNLPRTNQLDLIIQDPETTKITHKRLSKRKFKAALKDTSNVLEKMHTSVREKTERRRKSKKKKQRETLNHRLLCHRLLYSICTSDQESE